MKLEDIIKLGLSKGIEEIELYYSERESFSSSYSNGKLENGAINKLFNLSIRGIVNGKMGYVSLENLDEEPVNEALSKLIENASNITTSEKEFIFDGNAKYEKFTREESDVDKCSVNFKIILNKEAYEYTMSKINDYSKENPTVRMMIGRLGISDEVGKVRIVNSKGLNLTKDYAYAAFICYIIAGTQSGSAVNYEVKIAKAYKELDYKETVDTCINKVLAKLNPGSVKTNRYPVVLDKDVAGSLLQTYLSNFSGESAMYKATPLLDKVGTKLFGDNINIVDDPFTDKAIHKEIFDDEGVPCKKKYLIEKGVFKGFLHSQKTANYFGVELTGNGFKRGGTITPSETNVYLEPGDVSFDELLKGIEEGVYINDVNGLHAGVNPIAGTFNLQSSGFMIRNGKLAEAVTLFVVSGTFEELFNNVEMISNDVDKVFNGCNAPSIRIKSLAVSGK